MAAADNGAVSPTRGTSRSAESLNKAPRPETPGKVRRVHMVGKTGKGEPQALGGRFVANAEPWFVTFDADVQVHIVMSPEELGRAGLEELGKKWS